MQTLSSNQLPELIKSFELKINQQKDATQVKSGRPAAKMRLRDPAVVLEIARLRVLVSEMREKTMKMEAQVKSASEKSGKERRNSLDVLKGDMKDEEITTIDVEKKASMLAVDKTPDKVEITSACDINLVTTTESPLKCNGENEQDISKNENKKFLLEQRLRLDTEAIGLQAHIESLHHEVHGMLLELSTRPDLQEELAAAKERMKEFQEEIKDDASTTKAQLLLLKQQFGELESTKNASEHKEIEFQKASHVASALEAEVAELKKGNQELLKQKQELCKKLIEKGEKIKPPTKDDVLASEAEVSKLRSTNVELQKKVESLQISRFNEVEEVVYLRWVNACLRHDLDVYKPSHRNFEDISNQIENCSPVVDSKDDLLVRTNSGHSSASRNDAHDYRASHNVRENMHEQCECGIKSSPQLSNHVNSAHSSPASIRHGRRNINISPLAIPHGLVSSSHSSPLASPLGHGDGSSLSSLASPRGHVDGGYSSPLGNAYGRLKSSHIAPQKSSYGEAKTKSDARHSTHWKSPTDIRLSQSLDACNPHQYSPGRMQLERDPQKRANIQAMLTFKADRLAKLDATSCTKTHTQNFPRRSGRSFDRSASTVSASSEGSINRTQGSAQMQDRRTFMRSSSNLSSDSDISNNLKSKSLLRRHSASSGMSLLDEYLHSTDTRSPNRPTSGFSAVLPHDRQFSNLKTVPFATMEEVTEPLKREDSTATVKAYSFENHLDASDRVVAAFQRLSSSTPTRSSHRTFKELSRRNSHDDKAESNVNQQPDKYDAPMSTTRSTQADFICDLARAVQATCYNSIEQVSAFVNWFDRQGEAEKQEFFKFPDCPRDKVEAMRRAVYEYEELRAFETDLISYKNMLEGPADFSLQDMKSLLEKVENYVEGFKQARGLAIAQFNELDIPTYWMRDSGMIAKIKQAALQLARRYIKRATKLLTTLEESGEVSRESSLVEAARFLLQVHNFVGGFDEDTANAFKLLQSQVQLQENNVVCSKVP